MPRVKKPRYQKKKRYGKKPAYRNQIPRSIENASLRPMSRTVKFQARERFLVADVLSANTKSILQIPATYLGTPTVISGTWTPDSGTFHNPTAYQEWFPKYKYYKVLGARMTATVRPSGIGAEGANQFQNLSFIALCADSNQLTGVSLEDLEEDRGIKQQHWRYSSLSGGMKGSRMALNYSAKKTHGLKDVKDYGPLRTPTTFNTAASENTYYNLILSGALDQATTGHPGAIVDVYATYILHFTEPTQSNIPE